MGAYLFVGGQRFFLAVLNWFGWFTACAIKTLQATLNAAAAAAAAKSLQSVRLCATPQLFETPQTSLLGSSVHGIFQGSRIPP